MLTTTLTHHPANQAIRLRNVTCPYCGFDLTSETATREHVVGRRFVPKGKLNGHWNLIVNACGPCNNRKADLENDVSAITLYTEDGEAHPNYDDEAIADAQRKAANAISRRTKKPVKESHEDLAFDVPFGTAANIGFNFTSPPQIDEARAFELARLQLAGFFFLLTYQKDQERGGFWPDGCYLLMMVRRADYGNPTMTDFANAVLNWEPRLIGHTAEGYFRVCIRKHPEADCWSWALEWNGSTRLVGFFGDKGAAQAVVDGLRKLEMHHLDLSDGRHIRFRTEVPLAPENDRLFDPPQQA